MLVTLRRWDTVPGEVFLLDPGGWQSVTLAEEGFISIISVINRQSGKLRRKPMVVPVVLEAQAHSDKDLRTVFATVRGSFHALARVAVHGGRGLR